MFGYRVKFILKFLLISDQINQIWNDDALFIPVQEPPDPLNFQEPEPAVEELEEQQADEGFTMQIDFHMNMEIKTKMMAAAVVLVIALAAFIFRGM